MSDSPSHSRRARILAPTADNLTLAAEALRRGELVGMPTETVYGLAGAALQSDALARIFETKERPTFDPLIVHVSLTSRGLWPLSRLGLIDLPTLSEPARNLAEALIQKLWPGPLTLVLPKNRDVVPDLATAGLGSVAIRLPAHPVAQALLAAAGIPLAAPSANRFGRLSPTSAADVAAELGDRIDLILDGGRCEIGVESTIVSVGADGTLTLLRPGGVGIEEIELLAGATLIRPPSAAPPGAGLRAPGMLESHYAPIKPLGMLGGPVREHQYFERVRGGSKVGLLVFEAKGLDASPIAARFARLTGCQVIAARVLTESGDLRQAASRLFAELRALDESDADVLFAEPCPTDDGLGRAISDRLRRASAKRG